MSELGTVLLVEDNPTDRALAEGALTGAGVEVHAVERIFDALQAIALNPTLYDVLVLDLNLPDSTGLSTLRTIAHSTTLPVVVHTGILDPEVRRWCALTGAVQVVGKDEGMESLLQAIRRVRSTSERRLMPPEGGASDTTENAFPRLVRRTLQHLADTVPMGAWMFTRVVDEDWIILDIVGDTYDLEVGQVLRWRASYCSRMVRGEGPRVAPDAQAVPAYAAAEVNDDLTIGSYCGHPIRGPRGEVFGTLCGVGPAADASLTQHEGVVDFAAEALSDALALELTRDRLQRLDDESAFWADLAASGSADPTLPHIGAFELFLRQQQRRTNRYGDIAGVCLVSATGNGSPAGKRSTDKGPPPIARVIADVIANRAQTIHATRDDPIGQLRAFSIGDGEYALVLSACTSTQLDAVAAALRQAARAAGVNLVVGAARQEPAGRIIDAVSRADLQVHAQHQPS